MLTHVQTIQTKCDPLFEGYLESITECIYDLHLINKLVCLDDHIVMNSWESHAHHNRINSLHDDVDYS